MGFFFPWTVFGSSFSLLNIEWNSVSGEILFLLFSQLVLFAAAVLAKCSLENRDSNLVKGKCNKM